MIVKNKSRYYFYFKFEPEDRELGEIGDIIHKIKESIPSANKGRYYFPADKIWLIHKDYLDDFIHIISEYRTGMRFLKGLIFRQRELFK